MSLQTTITRQQSPAQFPVSPIALFEEVVELKQKYSDWDDDLSKSLHSWIEHTISVISESSSESLQILSETAKTQIQMLFEILVNPIDRSPLESPMLNRRWTWEQTDLEDYQKFSPLSPHDGNLLSPQEHLFAKEMILWKESVYTFIPNQKLEVASAQEKPLRLFAYMQMAQNAMQVQALHALQNQMVSLTITCEQRSATLKRETAQEIARVKERTEQHHAAVEEKVITMAKTHKSIVSTQAQELEYHKKSSIERQEELSQTKNFLEKEQIRSQKIIDDLAQAYLRIQWLESELKDAQKGCVIL